MFLILVTVTVIVVSWVTHQLGNPRTQWLIAILIVVSLAVFFLLNYMDHKEEQSRRREKESHPEPEGGIPKSGTKPSDASFSLRDHKSGLTWGGGNIHASEATRGAKRKFLGR